jgi:single-stranded-DNA-specific exonuclease
MNVVEQPTAGSRIGLPPVLLELLRKRGFNEEEIVRFLKPDYSADLGDPFLMTDMETAVSRLVQAFKEGEKVAIYGDYDIDGITSTAILLEIFEQHGLEPITYIPDRYEEGYGLNQSALEQLKDQGVSLVVTVDCGITAKEEADWAKANGLDLIITDHHELGEELPSALAVINPKRPEDKYPTKEISGAGVAFALVRALQTRTGVPAAGQEKWLLDLVALGTVCDVMPLTGENRALVTFGLVVLRKTRRVGLVALTQSAGVELADIRSYHLGFILGPRLNAAGRLEHANFSLELLSTKDPIVAQQLAFHLEEMNHQRQLEQARIMTEADAQAAAASSDPVLVLADPGWPHGVVGIVASKLAEKWYKPTMVFQVLGSQAKGSGRSAGGYNLIEGLNSCSELFSKLGGHHFAAGFTAPTANLEEIRLRMGEHWASVEESILPRSIREAELAIENAGDLNFELHDALQKLEPFGNANSQPTFGLTGMKIITVQTLGRDKQHVKLKLTSAQGSVHEAIGFGLAEKYPNLKSGQVVDLVFFLEKNSFGGRTSLQFVILAVQ